MLFILELMNGILNVFLCLYFLGRCFPRRSSNRLWEISLFAATVLLSMGARGGENNLVNSIIPLASLILVTFVFKISWTDRLMSVAVLFSAGAFSDFVAYVMTGLLFPEDGAGSMHYMPAWFTRHILCLVLLYITLYLQTSIFREHEEYRAYQPVYLRWIMLLVPVAYMVAGNAVFYSDQGFVWNTTAASWPVIIALLFLYFLIFYFYQTLLHYGKLRAEKMVLDRMEEHYRKEISLVQQHQEKIRMMKHDMNNHLISLKNLMEKKDYEGSKAYIDEMVPELGMAKAIHTGNIMIDGILNSKIYLADQRNIPVHTDIYIPPDLNLSYKSITIIVGNLLDNALEACVKVSADKRTIRIKMFWLHQVLTFEVVNTYEGVIRKRGEHFLTDKQEDGHGMGLASVSHAVEQNSGELEISYHEVMPDGTKLFRVRILLYLDPMSPHNKEGE